MLASGRMVVAPFVLNALHARVAEEVGFGAVYMTGSGTSAEKGYADVGFLTQTEMVANARYIANAVSIPVVADADTGYGNAINVWRTVREYEDAGVAAIHIEDQSFPKKCGFFAGKQVIPADEMVGKLHAALDARRDPDFAIIARCDAYAVHGWEDTVARCRAYMDAGADMVFVDGIRTVDDLKSLRLRPCRVSPHVQRRPAAHPRRRGHGLQAHDMWAPPSGWCTKRWRDAFSELKEVGAVDPARYATRDDVSNLLGLPEVYEMERKYGVTPSQRTVATPLKGVSCSDKRALTARTGYPRMASILPR